MHYKRVTEEVFPYIQYRGRFYPIIPVVIEGKDRVVVHALIDSGATVSLFHLSIAEDIGIDLENAKEVYLAGVGGFVRAYLKERVRMTVGRLESIEVPIAFTEYISSDIAIIGRQGFFENFEIVFREWERKLIIRSKT